MKRIRILILLYLCFSVNGLSAQSRAEKKRIKLAKEFILAFQNDNITNAEIMKKFAAQGSYFHPDSARWRAAADDYLNDLRNWSTRLGRDSVVVYNYAGHEDEFAVNMRSTLDEEEQPSPHRLTFMMDLLKKRRQKVNPEDLFVIAKIGMRGAGLFVVFDKKNKILCFANMKSRNHISLWQW